MTNIVFTLIVFAVNSFVFGSQSSLFAPLLPERTASVARRKERIDLICEKDETDVNHSLLQKFNQLVGEYFQANFGDGGKQYLDSFEGCTDLSDRRYLIPEVEGIVHSFERSWFGKKKTDDVRFRLHRFLGILMLYKQHSSAVGFDFVIDYHTAFPESSERQVFDAKLRQFKEWMQTPAPTDPSYLGIVSDCLKLIGEFTKTEKGVIQHSTTVENWNVFNHVLWYYRACVEQTLQGAALKGEDTTEQDAVCNGIRLLLRESSNAPTRWHHAESILSPLYKAGRMGIDVPHSFTERRKKAIADLSLYGQAAQVLECFIAGSGTFEKCSVEKLKQVVKTLSPLARRLCASYNDFNVIRMVRVFFCVSCEPDVGKSRPAIVAECTQQIQDSDAKEASETRKQNAIVGQTVAKVSAEIREKHCKETSLNALVDQVYGREPETDCCVQVRESLKQNNPKVSLIVERKNEGNKIKLCIEQKKSFVECLPKGPRDSEYLNGILNKLATCLADTPDGEGSCIAYAKLRGRHIPEIQTVICMGERLLEKKDMGICKELNSWHEFYLSLEL